jgi:N-alpha-acetyl-L-2,4-diaminobutyrate deacetylase
VIFTKLDYAHEGKQQGWLQMPYSHNLGGWANLLTPLTVIKNGNGPTVLVLGGTHGDEFPGQIAVSKLANELEPDSVAGRIILIPTLNQPACRASTRLSPLDGKNLNRAFPGDRDGSATEQIADYLTSVLFPLADIVIDIHSGGRSLKFYPCTCMDLVPDQVQRGQMIDGALAWNADFLLLYLTDIAGTGLLPVQAQTLGKIVVTTEMGGGEWYPADVHGLTQAGLRNVLVYFGALKGEKWRREDSGQPPGRIVQSLDREDYVLATEQGYFEPLVDLGTFVRRGETVGLLHHLDRPDRLPEPMRANSDGYVMCFRAPCLTGQGDCVAVTAQEVELKRGRDALYHYP